MVEDTLGLERFQKMDSEYRVLLSVALTRITKRVYTIGMLPFTKEVHIVFAMWNAMPSSVAETLSLDVFGARLEEMHRKHYYPGWHFDYPGHRINKK